MSEAQLTQLLIQNLQRGDIKKITRTSDTRKVELRTEVGNNSFRADIFISLQKETGLAKGNLHSQTSFIAIEVKIKDWKQGLYQAWRYNSFAEKSYLAIYEPYAKNIDVTLFERYNVGLIVFNETEVVVRNRPKVKIFKKEDSYSSNLREKIWRSLSVVESV